MKIERLKKNRARLRLSGLSYPLSFSYGLAAVHVAVGVGDGDEVDVDVVEDVAVGLVVLDPLPDHVGRHGGSDPLASVHAL